MTAQNEDASCRHCDCTVGLLRTRILLLIDVNLYDQNTANLLRNYRIVTLLSLTILTRAKPSKHQVPRPLLSTLRLEKYYEATVSNNVVRKMPTTFF